MLSNEIPTKPFSPPEELARTLWDIKFASNIFNAAGMFKHGEGYYTVAAQGAGAYIAGTTTYLERRGNAKEGIKHPFAPYPASGASSNWMGLPNDGHAIVAKRLSKLIKFPNCPIGASIASSPEQSDTDAMDGIISGMKYYQEAAVDFIELNESCPNVHQSERNAEALMLDNGLFNRLEYISNKFLLKRQRNLPVILKISVDTDISLLPELLKILIGLKFDGINIGNTSTNYSEIRNHIADSEIKLFDYFINTFGGGVSGKPLKEKSLKLASFAADFINKQNLEREFHIIRTGGIDSFDDLLASDNKDISINQWFAGYFDNFSKYGHNLYRQLFAL